MSTTGYSGTPLLKKFGIKPEMKVLLSNPPDDYYSLLDVNISDQLYKNEVSEFVHLFVKTSKEFISEMKKLKPIYKKNTAITIWVSWYKKAALRQAPDKLTCDVTEDTIRNYALQNDLVDVKVCAVSEVWSGLKLAVPLSKR